MLYLSIYLAIINALGLLLMLADKLRAKKKQWRIPERILLLVAFLGGSLGTMLGMYAFRHKTKHPRFSIGVPVIMIVQAVIVLILLYV
jgi:uncharacterized membrane protein YsdA (DUF1294 family)